MRTLRIIVSRTLLFPAVALLGSLSNCHAQPSAPPSAHRNGATESSPRVERNIHYVEAGHPQQILDLYLPATEPERPAPLLIWIHGGAWLAGDHSHTPMEFLVNQGFAVASIQYRFSSHAIWPAQAHDCKAAIRFLRANAAAYHIAPERFGVAGASAGGHLSAVVGTSGDVAALEGELGNGEQSSRVQAVVDLFGPTDLTLMARQAGPESSMDHDAPDSPESRLMGGPIQSEHELARTANPLTYVDPKDPPHLIIHGDKDPLVPRAQSVLLATALIDNGVETTMYTIPGAGHGGPQFQDLRTRRLIVDFLNRHLSPPR
ncbi:MAG: alpha/beta hydrolase [Planctomycetales bacterium]|nr:alpha/beta hydrolase [Planctomycetales bacterium]